MVVSLLIVSNLLAGQGKIRVACDKEGAYIYVDGKKKAMTGEGFTNILLEEGDYTIKVVKPIDENSLYVLSKEVFVGAESSVKLTFKLKKEMTAKGKALQAQKDASKLARFERNGEVVTDTKLGLMWQDDSRAKSVEKSWSGAKSYCLNLSLEGYSDWRLPTYDELLSIVDYNRYKPAIIPSFQNVASEDYWSFSSYISDSKYAWSVGFKGGYTDYGYKSDKFDVRCVRDR
jgi:hypothetical protein